MLCKYSRVLPGAGLILYSVVKVVLFINSFSPTIVIGQTASDSVRFSAESSLKILAKSWATEYVKTQVAAEVDISQIIHCGVKNRIGLVVEVGTSSSPGI